MKGSQARGGGGGVYEIGITLMALFPMGIDSRSVPTKVGVTSCVMTGAVMGLCTLSR